MDLDHFRNVNDRFGHNSGDRLLVAVADRLRKVVGGCATVARLGGDEFIVLCDDLDDMSDVFALAKTITDSLRTPFTFGERKTILTASVGVALSVDGSLLDSVTMLRNADVAMYHAKDRGRDRVELFDETLQTALERRIELEESLGDALGRDEFEVYYQPIVDVASLTMTGVEALLRWDSPGRGAVSPAEFIPIAEGAGLIAPIGAWVLRQACTQAVTWRRHHGTSVKTAVNVSAHQPVDPAFPGLVASIVEETDIDPETLSIEVTETAVIDSLEMAVINLKRIRGLGVQIALDDFGTGYASLSYLQIGRAHV